MNDQSDSKIEGIMGQLISIAQNQNFSVFSRKVSGDG